LKLEAKIRDLKDRLEATQNNIDNLIRNIKNACYTKNKVCITFIYFIIFIELNKHNTVYYIITKL